MKAYVSYIIQNRNGHSHESTIINITCCPYNTSSNTPISEALEWTNKSHAKFKYKEKIIFTSVYKI